MKFPFQVQLDTPSNDFFEKGFAFSPDGFGNPFVYTKGERNSCVYMIDTENNKAVKCYDSGEERLSYVYVCPLTSGEYPDLIVCCDECVIRRVKYQTGEVVWESQLFEKQYVKTNGIYFTLCLGETVGKVILYFQDFRDYYGRRVNEASVFIVDVTTGEYVVDARHANFYRWIAAPVDYDEENKTFLIQLGNQWDNPADVLSAYSTEFAVVDFDFNIVKTYPSIRQPKYVHGYDKFSKMVIFKDESKGQTFVSDLDQTCEMSYDTPIDFCGLRHFTPNVVWFITGNNDDVSKTFVTAHRWLDDVDTKPAKA